MMNLNQAQSLVIDINDIQVEASSIVELLGYGVDDSDAHTDEVINQSIEESLTLLDPMAGFIVLPVGKLIVADGELTISDETFAIDKIIASQLNKAKYIALFTCTIGKRLEHRSKELMEHGDFLEAYVFDLIGSEAAEACASILHDRIKQEAAKSGLKITNRFSPGYCNWNVQEQFKLFSFFPENFCGIKLTASALMNPVKSVSGFVGVGEEVVFKRYTCSMCSDKNCIYRNRKSHAG